jgi:hypothetical protein
MLARSSAPALPCSPKSPTRAKGIASRGVTESQDLTRMHGSGKPMRVLQAGCASRCVCVCYNLPLQGVVPFCQDAWIRSGCSDIADIK